MRDVTTSSRVACDQEKFTAFAVTGVNAVGSSSVLASLEQERSHPDGSPRIALGLVPYDVTTGPEKTAKRNRQLYGQDFLLQYLVFDHPVPYNTAQAYTDRLADIAAVWFMAGYEYPLIAVPLEAGVTDVIRYSDLVQPALEENPLTLEVPSVVRLLAYGCYTATEWNRDRVNRWQVLLSSRRLQTAVHFLRTSIDSYWRDLIDWKDQRRFGGLELEIAPGPGDTAYQNAYKCVEEIIGGALPRNLRQAKLKLRESLTGDYAVNPGTRWRHMDTDEECDIVEAVVHMQEIRNARTAHGGTAYKPPLREAEILDAQYLARFLLMLCSKQNPSRQRTA